jgi:hypothetical protein
MTIYTASQLAKQLGCTSQTITRNAANHGIGQKHGSSWVFEKSDIRKMQRVLDENYKRDWARMGRLGMGKRWHGKKV